MRSVAVALLAGVASSCSGTPEASGPDAGPPASSTSPAPSASPSPTASATLDAAARARIPKAARAHTPVGAEAFARFYLEQVNEAWMKPDPELIRPYALESCKTCANYVETSEWLMSGGMKYAGPPMELGTSIVAPESTKDHAFVEMACNQTATDILRSDGAVQKRVPHRFGGCQVELTWRDVWRVHEVRVNA